MQPKNTTAHHPLNSGGPSRPSPSPGGSTKPSTPAPGRSQRDLRRWGAELLIQNGFRAEHGYHIVVWEHDDGCPLHPDHAGCASSRCRCQPDATLVLHVGTPQQREVDVVREGIPLPIRPGGLATS